MLNVKYFDSVSKFTKVGWTVILVVLIGGFSLTAVYGQAQASTSTLRVPFSTELLNCPPDGEFIQISGTALLVLHTTLQPNGEISLNVNHLSGQGLKGTTSSGDPVAVSLVSRGVASQSTPNSGVFTTNVHTTLAVNGQPNTVITFVLHTIINEDGSTRMEHTHTDVKCVGA